MCRDGRRSRCRLPRRLLGVQPLQQHSVWRRPRGLRCHLLPLLVTSGAGSRLVLSFTPSASPWFMSSDYLLVFDIVVTVIVRSGCC